RWEPGEQDAGDLKGPPNSTSTTLAPTDRLASCLTSRFRLMRMRADQSAMCAINRHLRFSGFICQSAKSAVNAINRHLPMFGLVCPTEGQDGGPKHIHT